MENQKNKNIYTWNKGFSLVEVLVALALVSVVFSMALSFNFSDSEKLDEAVTSLEKAVRFGSDETTLKGAITRIHFNLDTDPQTYALQYGPKNNFVLPSFVEDDLSKQSEREKEEQEKKDKNLKQKFNKIREFNEEDIEINELIKVVGIGTSLKQDLTLEGETSVYMYPTGEKDGAIIFLSTAEEFVAVKIEPFTNDITKEYITLDEVDEDELVEKQVELAKKLYEIWLKE